MGFGCILYLVITINTSVIVKVFILYVTRLDISPDTGNRNTVFEFIGA